MASENDDDDDARDARVAAVAATCAPCELRPRAFFVAWSGVLALAFEGFPPAIASAKRALDATLGASLPAENPGSRWAKCTLGCLRDGVTLTREQLAALTRACARFEDALRSPTRRRIRSDDDDDDDDDEDATTANGGRVAVDRLSIVRYACRSLERVASERVVACEGWARARARAGEGEGEGGKEEEEEEEYEVRSIHWSPYDRVGVVNADP
jgi:hypothetical protein